MNRTIDYVIARKDAGIKISDYLKGQGYSTQSITDLIHQKSYVCLNGEEVFLNTILSEKDLLQVFICEEETSEHILPVHLPMDIVYEDEDVLVVNKPAGMPSHPSMKNYDNTLANAVMHYYKEQGKQLVYRCINRLDKDTTGLTIIAKHMIAAGILYAGQKEGKIHREYSAIVCGTITPDTGVIDKPIGRKNHSTIEREIDYENGSRAVTHYHVLGSGGGLTYVSCRLETGRTHQIRVHMKSIGHPLIGDFLYNADNQQMERQALHAGRLEFEHPMTKEWICLSAKLPDDMKKIMIQQMGLRYDE